MLTVQPLIDAPGEPAAASATQKHSDVAAL